MRRLRRLTAPLVLGLVATFALAACGGGSSSGPANASSETKVIDVTFKGEDVTPNGERIEVSVDQPITLHVTADKPGEIHVHSDPEQEFEYKAGTSDITMDPITKPGVVEVESHTLDKVLFQLEVR
jgi:ABC-type glycerol-3-phosphate transport system substrate-binding protein